MARPLSALWIVALVVSSLFLFGCNGEADPEPALPDTQVTFWDRVEAICGQAFEGEVIEAPEYDDTFDEGPIIMHVRQCFDDEIRIPLHVAEDRSRTWILSQTDTGLRLKHDHRHEDGTEEEVTQYGGDTADAGTPSQQDFPADEFTAELIPEAEPNVWTLEIDPGDTFVYALDRQGTDHQYRMEFDLTEPVDPPPAPWGYEDTDPTPAMD